MRIAFFSCHDYEKAYIEKANTHHYELIFIDDALDSTTIEKAKGCVAISVFSSDVIEKALLKKLDELGVGYIATRSAGTDHIDLKAAEEFDIQVANVPEYSPNAIAEHCIALTLALYRKLRTSFQRTSNYNFSLQGLVGYEINSKTVGICGTGDIGEVLAHLYHAFGVEILLYDVEENPNLKDKSWATYVELDTLLEKCDIISLNMPLNESTKEFIGPKELERMKDSAILVNTSRGELVHTRSIRDALREQKISGYAMDVYENEKGIFSKDLSNSTDKDKLLESLIEMDNVVVTAHQAFLTDTALRNMMETTFKNIEQFKNNGNIKNLVSPEH